MKGSELSVWFSVNLENIETYHSFRRLWLISGVKLMEIDSNFFFSEGCNKKWCVFFFFFRANQLRLHKRQPMSLASEELGNYSA